MPNHHRVRIPGGTYFFTVNLLERHPNNLLVRHIDALRDAVQRTRQRHPFHFDAWVVLPDHLHAVWTLPEGDLAYENRWRTIKELFLGARGDRASVRRAVAGGRAGDLAKTVLSDG
jgi:putative transposase